MTCYNVVFKKDLIKTNIGFYIGIVIILLLIFCIFYFYVKEHMIIQKEINDITLSKINMEKNKNSFGNSKSIVIKDVKTESRNVKLVTDNYPNEKFNGFNFSNQNRIKNNYNVTFGNFRNDFNVLKFNDTELNKSSYNIALMYDKRTYFQYYMSLLFTKHIILFSFSSKKVYNSRAIKIFLFFFIFILHIVINALFFTERLIHKIYVDGGKYDFAYNIPQIIYSSLISVFINFLINILALFENGVIELKQEKKIYLVYNKKKQLLKCIFMKSVVFFFLSLILLILFGYYFICFCSIYKNTQIYLLINSILSFAFSLLYPIVLYLLPGLFRIKALRANKKDKETLYNFSKIVRIL